MVESIVAVIAETGVATGSGLSPKVVVQNGVTLGSALAIVCSWHRNRSLLWAIVAGFLTWFYVIYFALTRKDDEKR